jgi:hypothetical protein
MKTFEKKYTNGFNASRSDIAAIYEVENPA